MTVAEHVPQPAWVGLLRRVWKPGCWLPLLSALLLFAAYPPLDLGYLAWIALVPLLFALAEGGFWRGFRRALWFGTLFFLGNLIWLLQFIANWIGSIPLAFLPWVLLSIIEGLYIALFGGAVALACRRYGSLGLIIAPPAWGFTEWLRSSWPAGGFGWAQLSYTQWKSPVLLAPVAVGGTHLLAFLIVLTAVGVVLALGKPQRQGLGFVLLVAVAVVLGTSQLLFLRALPVTDTIRVAAAQPAFDVIHSSEFEWGGEFEQWKQDRLEAAGLAGVQVVVFPESYQFAPPRPERPPPTGYIASGHRVVNGKVYHTAYGASPDGTVTTYDKSRLVIFGEYVPFRDRLPFLDAFRLPGGDVTAAPPGQPLRVRGLDVVIGICFENLFPEVLRAQVRQGADLIAVLSLDDWYPPAGINQHAAVAVVRAVECRRPLVRSGSTGVTMIVSARGVVLASLPIGVREMVIADVPVASRTDVPGRLHDLFPWLCLIGVIAALAWRKRKPAKN
ncbi:MAG: apolipoprotein N-acyltransferase [Fimbriimonadia bacterium]|jgi:apolipoprotein N-acyltransferase